MKEIEEIMTKGYIMEETIVEFLLRLKMQIELMHWQTTSYARHMAYGRVYDTLEELIDSFVEVYQGKYGRLKVTQPIVLNNIQDEVLENFIDEIIQTLQFDIPSQLDENDTDLLNIRDEILTQMNLLKYLITLS